MHKHQSVILKRYVVVNNLAVLDAPGEYVCTQQGDTATFSWIPPPATPQEGLVPVSVCTDVAL